MRKLKPQAIVASLAAFCVTFFVIEPELENLTTVNNHTLPVEDTRGYVLPRTSSWPKGLVKKLRHDQDGPFWAELRDGEWVRPEE